MVKTVSNDLGKFCYHYPRLAVIITARFNNKATAMAAAWHMPVSNTPSIYAVSISPKRFTYELIISSNMFGVNFLPFEKAEMLAATGGSSGRTVDKFQKYAIEEDSPESSMAPILRDAYAAYECRLLDDREYGDHRILVGEIVSVHWLKEAFNEEGVIDLGNVAPALFLGQELYISTDKNTERLLDRKVYSRGLKEA